MPYTSPRIKDWSTTTPFNFKVCVRQKVPTKYFKICNIFYYYLMILYVFSSKFPGIYIFILHRPGNEKWKKTTFGFHFHRIYGRFWFVSLNFFVKHKPWNWKKGYVILYLSCILYNFLTVFDFWKKKFYPLFCNLVPMSNFIYSWHFRFMVFHTSKIHAR